MGVSGGLLSCRISESQFLISFENASLSVKNFPQLSVCIDSIELNTLEENSAMPAASRGLTLRALRTSMEITSAFVFSGYYFVYLNIFYSHCDRNLHKQKLLTTPKTRLNTAFP